jgi:uncharacterized lipoprotein YmbA
LRTRTLAALLAGILVAGCLGQQAPRKTRYVLAVKPVHLMDPGARGVVQINRVRVASLFERKGLVYRTGEDRYEADFYHEFYAPPGELIREALSEWLWRSGVFADVMAPSMSGEPDWWLEGHVTALYADVRRPQAPEVVLAVVWSLLDPNAPGLPVVFSKSYEVVVALPDRDPTTVVDGFRRALTHGFEQLSADVVAALDARRSAAGEPAVKEPESAPPRR